MEVTQPRLEETGSVVKKAGGRSEHLYVTGPAQPLVTLRTVGRDIQKVAAHTPHHVLVEPIDQRVGALEPTGALHIRMANYGADVASQRDAGPAGHLGIAKTMEGEARLPGFCVATPQRVAISGFRKPERPPG